MHWQIFLYVVLLLGQSQAPAFAEPATVEEISAFQKDQRISDFRVANLYRGPDGGIVGAKFWHIPTGAPVYLLQIETVPQVFMWVDTPTDSNKGIAHSLEHLLAGKGTKGRYANLLTDMRLSRTVAVTDRDFNYYGFSSGSGVDGFFEQFHAWLEALFHPDFTDTEAEMEFYHFGVFSDPANKAKRLIEAGSVYDEMQSGRHSDTSYFELNKRVLGRENPFAFEGSGFPTEMRGVTPDEIRRFHAKHYHLGNTTGFIIALRPKENVTTFLQGIAKELRLYSNPEISTAPEVAVGPKYSIQPSEDTAVLICPFPSGSDADPGETRLAWRPVKTESRTELKLLDLFFRAFADGQHSVLYKALVDNQTREFDSGAKGVGTELLLDNSPSFPVQYIRISGIPGNKLSSDQIERLRNIILQKIKGISEYPDQSADLAAFNRLVLASVEAAHRTERVWVKSPPLFGAQQNADWKRHLAYLEMDSSFVRSLSDDSVWQSIEDQLGSQKNVWRGIIQRFHLLDTPYAVASKPSTTLKANIEKEQQERIETKVGTLKKDYHTEDQQEALSLFERDQSAKTHEIESIEARVPKPHFTDHPPLTPDDDIRYRQSRLLNSVPVIASIFERPPTMDIGISFDLSDLPRQYYKYLPLIPRFLDSVGLKEEGKVTSYAELSTEIQREILNFSIAFEEDPVAKREDLVIRASATNAVEFRKNLELVGRILHFNYLDVENADRLRDLVAQRLFFDDSYTKRDEFSWIQNPAFAFRHQDDILYLALNSSFTRAHWNGRLKWLLHRPVEPQEIERVGNFARQILASPPISRESISKQAGRSDLHDLERELLEYWERSAPSFPEAEMTEGMKNLTLEVQEDLRKGPARVIQDLRELQEIILNRRAVHLDLMMDQSTLDGIQPELLRFVKSIPARSAVRETVRTENNPLAKYPIMANLEKRYKSSHQDFPWYIALVNRDGTTGNVVAYADFPGFDQIDRQALIQGLSSRLLSGTGPQSFFIKGREAGLAYAIAMASSNSAKVLWYYADRISDIPSFLGLTNSLAAHVPELRDPFLVDYALRHTFSSPRAANTFSQRATAIARDIRDGRDPEKVRRFSEAILKLRQDPNLLSELTSAGRTSICGVLLDASCKDKQRENHSLFFFVGPERVLADTEKWLQGQMLLRVWPSDYWIE